MSSIANQLAREHPDTDRYLGVHVVPLATYLVGSRERLTLGLFVGAVTAVLLMACANVAGLFVSHTFARRQAVAIRIALGAGHGDILRQVLAEGIRPLFEGISLWIVIAVGSLELIRSGWIR